MQQRDQHGNQHIKKLNTIVRIVLLSFVLTIIIHYFIFLHHGKFRSQGVFWILRDVGELTGAKTKTRKSSLNQKINPQKILCRSTHRQNYSVKIKPTKKILVTFFLPRKNPGIENFKPKKSFYHRLHLKSGLPQLEFRSTPNFLIKSLLMAYFITCLLYTSPSPRDGLLSRMPSSA